MNEFSCCSRYALCDYGRGECLYLQIDTTATERCRSYNLKRKAANQFLYDKPMEQSPIEEKKEDDLDQLSLF